MTDLRLGVAAAGLKAVLIIDATDVAHNALVVEDDTCGLRRAQFVGQLIVQILEEAGNAMP